MVWGFKIFVGALMTPLPQAADAITWLSDELCKVDQ
jgi:hypothetical protein